MKEPTSRSSECYRIVYATFMREIWLAETNRKSQLALRRIDDISKSLERLRKSALNKKTNK